MRTERPDGRNPADYARFRDADLERLAWEFLRRSAAYQVDCQRFLGGAADAKAVAAKWSLFEFKHYTDGYSRGRRPRFLPTLVRSFPNSGSTARTQRVTLQSGQIAFVVNASALVNWSQAKEAQLNRLSRRLNDFVSIIGADHVGEPKPLQPKSHNYIECLQMLDLLHSGASPAEIKQLIPSIRIRGGEDASERADRNKRFSNLKRQALDLATRGYIELAIVGAARRPPYGRDLTKKQGAVQPDKYS